MKPLALQAAILSHLRGAGRPVSSRDLAARFLRIERGDEETCRRLLAPMLAEVPEIAHRPAEGWSFVPRPRAATTAAGAPPARRETPPATGGERPPAAAPATAPSPRAGGGLRDFVALAADGAGPGGSGTIRAISLLPVLAGEPCQEEHLPQWGLDSDGSVSRAEPPDDAAPAAISGARGALAAADFESLIETVGDLPVVCHRVGREVEPLTRACATLGLPFHPVVISAAKLGHLILGLKPGHAAIDLAAALDLTTHGPDDCRGRARTVAGCFLAMVPRLEERGIDSFEVLVEFQAMPPVPIDLSGYGFTAERLREIPASPGVYRFVDRGGEVIYVGKARSLRARVASYFVPSARGTAKGRAILERTHTLEIETCASELEASLLEAALIAEHRPSLNRQFEIHERPAPYGPRLNLVVVLPDRPPDPGPAATCTLHFLRGGRYLGRERGVAPAARPGPRIEARVARDYFSGHDAGPEPVDIDWILVGSFLRSRRDLVNVLDVDECATAAEALDRLRVLIAAACGPPGGRVVAR